MRALSLPSNVDAQLFKAITTTRDIDSVTRLIDQGARIDTPFSVNYELLRGQTTTFTLCALEALLVGWDLIPLSRILHHLGPLPDVMLPNIATALHTVNYVKNESTRSAVEKYNTHEKSLLWNLAGMCSAMDCWHTTFLTTAVWECIVCKSVTNAQHTELPNIIHALGNLPIISDETSLERVWGVAKNYETCGVLLCTKFGVAEELRSSETYQKLHQKSLANPLDPFITKLMLEREVGGVGCKITRKM